MRLGLAKPGHSGNDEPCAAASSRCATLPAAWNRTCPASWRTATCHSAEGINNKIKVIKRIAYGFRDDAYFFLKIRAAFPGLG